MYTWRVPEKPDVTDNELVYVDDRDCVWQWTRDSETDPRLSKWSRKADWYLEEVAQARVLLSAVPMNRRILSKAISVPIREWDELYSKAFYRFEFSPEESGPTTVYHRARASKKNAEAFLESVAPNDGTNYQGILVIRFFQVVDPTIKCYRTGHSNEMYSLLRGSHAHNRNSGRENQGLPSQYGLSPKIQNPRWNDLWHVDTAKKFLNWFFGITTAPSGDVGRNIFNFSRGVRNFYRQPKTGTQMQLVNRWWYNVVTNSYVDMTGLDGVGAGIGQPGFFMWYPTSVASPRQLVHIRNLRGGDYFSKNMRGVLVYPLTAQNQGGQALRAFLVRPYGMDIVGLGCNRTVMADSSWMVIAENVYPDSFTTIHKIVDEYWDLQDRDLVTFRIAKAIKVRGGGRSFRLESSGVPERVYFYLQNAVSGVRSEKFSSSIQIVRRRNNMTVGVLPSHR